MKNNIKYEIEIYKEDKYITSLKAYYTAGEMKNEPVGAFTPKELIRDNFYMSLEKTFNTKKEATKYAKELLNKYSKLDKNITYFC
jgi:hypothetical protein